MQGDVNNFAIQFELLTGSSPFPWQEELYARFISDRTDNIPDACLLPTGLGKTSVIAIWLLARLAHGRPQIPPVPGPLANRVANRVLSVSLNGGYFRAQKSAAPLKHPLVEFRRPQQHLAPFRVVHLQLVIVARDHQQAVAFQAQRGIGLRDEERHAHGPVPPDRVIDNGRRGRCCMGEACHGGAVRSGLSNIESGDRKSERKADGRTRSGARFWTGRP